MNIGERIKILRKELKLNQTEFGERIGVKQGSVAGYETGARTPLDTVISSMCREFNVNEEWLRTGNNEMFNNISKENELMMWAGNLLKDEDSFKYRFISMLSQLDENDWETVAKFTEFLLNQKKE